MNVYIIHQVPSFDPTSPVWRRYHFRILMSPSLSFPLTFRAASIACITMSAFILTSASSTSEAPFASPAARNSARADANSWAVVPRSRR